MITIQNENVLVHHGILGMKWGVRRYQNYDGSYTQAGMRRYNKSMEKYDAANKRLKEAKASGDKQAIKKARSERNTAKSEVKKDYADTSKNYRYEKGKERIASNRPGIIGTKYASNVASIALAKIGKRTMTWAKNRYTYGYGKASTVNALYAIGMLSYAGAIGVQINKNVQVNRMKAYYTGNHTKYKN